MTFDWQKYRETTMQCKVIVRHRSERWKEEQRKRNFSEAMTMYLLFDARAKQCFTDVVATLLWLH